MTKEVNLAYYRKKDWGKFLKLIDDRENMHDSWIEWNKSYLKSKEELTLYGFVVNEVVVDLKELKDYCTSKNIGNNGKARAEFISEK